MLRYTHIFLLFHQLFLESIEPSSVSVIGRTLLGGGKDEGRIINGLKSPKGKWPFMVSIMFGKEGQHFCGGSIINDDSILTASHCGFPLPSGQVLNPSDVYVYIGHINRASVNPAYLYQAKSFQTNADFVATKVAGSNSFTFRQGGDVAIIKLRKKIDLDALGPNVAKICLPAPNAQPIGEKCIVIGWGRTAENSENNGSEDLMEATVPLLPASECSKTGGYDSNKIICAGNLKAHTDACQGDSGGPLICPHRGNVYEYLQFGIVSFGVGCGEQGGFYTNVSVFIEWIRQRAETADTDVQLKKADVKVPSGGISDIINKMFTNFP